LLHQLGSKGLLLGQQRSHENPSGHVVDRSARGQILRRRLRTRSAAAQQRATRQYRSYDKDAEHWR
jgi:hypothetical protein